MREGSYMEIRPGMRVVGRDGVTIGGVTEVIVDGGAGIFIGLAVRPDLVTHALKVPGEAVDRLHEDVVYVDTIQVELKPYSSPEERRHDAVETYEGALT